MRNFIRFLATALVAALIVCAFCVTTSAANTKFTDVDDKNEVLSNAVGLLEHLGITKGTTETTFGTYENVTRQQMAAFVYRFLHEGKSLGESKNYTSFTDLTDSTYYGYISWASDMGIIKGTSETTFNPKGSITLQDAYTMIVRALSYDDTDFAYPYDYIDIAELPDVDLPDGLDAVVGYKTNLTRADVAILLYNAFFAETGLEENYKNMIPLENGDMALESKTYNPTFAEEYYDVEVGEFVVRATPKYAFNDSPDSDEYEPLEGVLEGEQIHFVAIEDDEALPEFYAEFGDLGLAGKADDYIMRTLKVFYTYTEKNEKKIIDKVYFANGAYSVIETNNAVGYYLDGKREEEYFDGTSYAQVTGYITVNGEEIYFFGAPYSYAKPKFDNVSGMTPEQMDQELDRRMNEKNVKFIDIKMVDDELGTYSYYLLDDAHQISQTDHASHELIRAIQRVYSKGAYKLKFFDVDGDGLYNYVHYMPATYGFMDGNEKKSFATEMDGNEPIFETVKKDGDLDLGFKPVIYYNEATIGGAKFEDGDMVLAYLNPEANMIEVMTVVKPFKGYADFARDQHGTVRIDGTTFQSAYSYRVCEGFNDGDESNVKDYNSVSNQYRTHVWSDAKTFPLLFDFKRDTVAEGEVIEMYGFKAAFGGSPAILYYDHIADFDLTFDMDDIVIPMSDEDGVINTYTTSKFEGNIGRTVYYIPAYTEGKQAYIAVNPTEMYPNVPYNGDMGEYYFGGALSSFGSNENAYVDKLCKFTVDSYGRYTLIPLLHAFDDEGKYIGVSRDEEILFDDEEAKMYGNDLGAGSVGRIVKGMGARYQLVGRNGDTLLGEGDRTKFFKITNSTRIIIKNKIDKNEEEYEYLEYNVNNFSGSTSENSYLSNIQYVLKNDPTSSNCEELVILYAEATEFEFEKETGKGSWRIVSSSSFAKDEEGLYRNYYTLLNPYTGEVTEKVAGDEVEEKAKNLPTPIPSGTVIKLDSAEIDEDKYKTLATLDTSVSAGLSWISEYDAEGGYISVVPVAETDNETFCCETAFAEYVEAYSYDGTAENFDGKPYEVETTGFGIHFDITDETAVTVIKSDEPGADAFENGTFSAADFSVIEDNSKDYRCYNTRVVDKKNNVTTKQTKFIKAYVYTTEAESDENAEVEFIIIVVNGDEDYVYSDYDSKLDPSDCGNH